MRRFVLALLAGPLLAGSAHAQTAGPAAPAPDGSQLPPGITMTPPLQKLQDAFTNANTTHDGRLTRAQAQAAMPMIARNFTAIDTANRGYVTFDDVLAWHFDLQARRLEQEAAALRAQD